MAIQVSTNVHEAENVDAIILYHFTKRTPSRSMLYDFILEITWQNT
jgi:hypothetical protein